MRAKVVMPNQYTPSAGSDLVKDSGQHLDRISRTQLKLQRVAPGVSPVLTPKATDGLRA
jgi:hypothetical protein